MKPTNTFDEGDFFAEIRKVDWGKVKAVGDVTFRLKSGDELTAFGFRIIQLSEKEKPWVALPQSSYLKDGETKNRQLLDLSRSLKKRLTDAILAAYESLK